LSERLSKRYPAKKLIVDYADDLALTSDTVANASSLLHHLENTAKDVGLYVNTLKTEHINLDQQGSWKPNRLHSKRLNKCSE